MRRKVKDRTLRSEGCGTHERQNPRESKSVSEALPVGILDYVGRNLAYLCMGAQPEGYAAEGYATEGYATEG
jgi:hypothetical protein